MRNTFVVALTCSVVVGYGCDRGTGPSIPTLPSPTPSVASPPPRSPAPAFPSVAVGEVVRFQFTNDDTDCVGGGGRCRSYNVTAPSDGRLLAEVKSVSGDPSFLSTMEMYVVPGGDFWDTGPGPRISVTIQATAGRTYEVRMYSALVPSVDLELLASLSPA
jgi:hypothetical protein